jgi:hypothetical protein
MKALAIYGSELSERFNKRLVNKIQECNKAYGFGLEWGRVRVRVEVEVRVEGRG